MENKEKKKKDKVEEEVKNDDAEEKARSKKKGKGKREIKSNLGKNHRIKPVYVLLFYMYVADLYWKAVVEV